MEQLQIKLCYSENRNERTSKRCYELDGETINSKLDAFRKTCESIPGMITDPNEPGKCITNSNCCHT